MSNHLTQKTSDVESRRVEGKKKPNILHRSWSWLIKGTVAEPWPTAKELFEDKEVRKEIEKVRQASNKK